MIARIVSSVLFLLWLVLVFAVGKGGLVHLILIAAVCFGMVDAVATYRARMTIRDADGLQV